MIWYAKYTITIHHSLYLDPSKWSQEARSPSWDDVGSEGVEVLIDQRSLWWYDMIWYVQLERAQLHPSPQPPSVDIMAIFNTRALVRRNYCKLIGSVLPSCSCQKVRAHLPCKTAGPKAAQNVIFLAQPRPRSLGSWKDPGGVPGWTRQTELDITRVPETVGHK